MKKATFLVCLIFLLSAFSLSAQNFYVAFVKGKVYYQEKLLKPRDKVTLKGEFRFTTVDDFVKITGPTGIHTIRPVKKEGGGFEFILAVTEELFPAPRLVSTSVLSTSFCPGDFFRLYCPNEYTAEVFFDGESRSFIYERADLLPDQIYYLFESKKLGYQLRQANLPDDRFQINRADYTLADPSDSVLGQVHIIAVHDKSEMERLIIAANEERLAFPLLDHLAYTELDFEFNVIGNHSTDETTRDEEAMVKADSALAHMERITIANNYQNKEVEAHSLQAEGVWRPATLLNSFRPTAVIPNEELMDDFFFHMIVSENADPFDFMIGMSHDGERYAEYVKEKYGPMNYRAVVDYFEEDYLPKKLEESGVVYLWNRIFGR
ncbi:MAG: hypothetical protein AAF741_15970 [Bacteroidota bacterium]